MGQKPITSSCDDEGAGVPCILGASPQRLVKEEAQQGEGQQAPGAEEEEEQPQALFDLAAWLDQQPEVPSTWRLRCASSTGGLVGSAPLCTVGLDDPVVSPESSECGDADGGVVRRRNGSRTNAYPPKHVHFSGSSWDEAVGAAQKRPCAGRVADCAEFLAKCWSRRLRHLLLVPCSLYELWSMAVFLGFTTEPNMAGVLQYLLVLDYASNTVYLIDTLAKISEQLRQPPTGETAAGRWPSPPIARLSAQLVLALVMYLVLLLMGQLLRLRFYWPWLLLAALAIRLSRVAWAASQTIRFINREEMDVYVDIQIHGTAGSVANTVRVVGKQFLIVLFWGHWVGCVSYSLRSWSLSAWDTMGNVQPPGPGQPRDYFTMLDTDGRVQGYTVGWDFGSNYMVSLYRGFHWNFEDLVPERPQELLLELVCSAGIVAIKSYCVGSFFKYHQKQQDETQKFNQLMESLAAYNELHGLPPSLQKQAAAHFRYQQERRPEVQTQAVLAALPLDAQKQLREQEYLPIVVGRNPGLFGAGVPHDFCMQLVMLLAQRFMQPRETIFLEGDVPRELVFLDSGTVALSRFRSLGSLGKMTEQLTRYLRGDHKEDPTVLGEASFLLQRPQLYSARVSSGMDATVLVLTRACYQGELIAAYPEQHEALLRNMAEGLLLDVHGAKDLHDSKHERTAEQDTDHFQDLRTTVRQLLRERWEEMQSSIAYAASAGDVRKVRELLAKRVDVNTSDYDRRSALHLAASEGMPEVIKVLLNAQADANFKDRWGCTPLQDALKSGCMGGAQILQQHRGTLGLEDPSGALCTCASEGDLTKMQQLLDFAVDINAGDYDNRTAMHLAASEGRLTVMAFLLDRSANVNVKDRWGSTPLEDAIRNGFHTVAKHLRGSGGRMNGDFGANLLCEAASVGNLGQLQMLIDSGVDVNEGDYDQRTAMHLAAAEGQLLAIRLLCGADADVSPLDRWGGTPLNDALTAGHEHCVQVLLLASAQLGPGASGEVHQRVAETRGEWYRDNGRVLQERAAAYRKLLSRHCALAAQGRARTDTLDLEKTIELNMRLLGKQVCGLREFCRDAGWLVALLRHLEEAATDPMQHFQLLLEEATAMTSELRFWTKMKPRQSTRQGGSKVAKDAGMSIFDKVFFGTLQVAPLLTRAIDDCAERLLKRADHLCAMQCHGREGRQDAAPEPTECAPLQGGLAPGSRGTGDSTPSLPRLSEVLAEELLAALGWSKGKDHGGPEHGTVGLAALGTENMAQQRRVAGRLEAVAGELLPSTHLLAFLCRTTLDDRLLTAPAAEEQALPGTTAAASGLGAWLHSRSKAVLHGQQPPSPLPPVPPGTHCSAAYAALWPGTGRPEPQRKAIATELATVALTALALDAWDSQQPAKANGRDGRKMSKQGAMMLQRRGSANFSSSDQPLVSRGAVENLGRILQQAAAECQGRSAVAAEEQQHILRMERALKRQKARERGGGDEEGAARELELLKETEEPGPIQLAKVLAQRGGLQLDELTAFMDLSDDQPQEEERRSRLLGPLSRSRFALGMVRWITGSDEHQKVLVSEVGDTSGPAADGGHTVTEEDLALYAELAETEGVSSHAASSGEDSQGDAEQVYDSQEESHCSDSSQPTKTHRDSITERSHVEGPGSPLDRAVRLLHRVVSTCGREGSRRRQQARIAKRFRELDEDGEGVGVAEVAQLLGTAFHHTMGHEKELRCAHRIFELLRRDEIGELVSLADFLLVLPQLEQELEQQRRRQHSSAGAGSDGVWHMTKLLSRMVVPPDAAWLRFWDCARYLAVIYYTLEVPVRFSFVSMDRLDHGLASLLAALNVLADTFMVANTLLNFFRSFVHPTRGFITSFQEIRVHYLLGFFFLDATACLPLDYMVANGPYSSTVVSRPVETARLLRLLHMRQLLLRDRLQLETESEQRRRQIAQGFFRTAAFLVRAAAVMVHFLACTWWLLGSRLGDPRSTWIDGYVERPGEPLLGDDSGATPFWWQYLVSFYWSAGRITGVGTTGLMKPGSLLELGWCCVLFLISFAVSGYVDGILGNKVIAQDEGKISSQAMQRIVDQFLQSRDLPEPLTAQIRASAGVVASLEQERRALSVASLLPHPLRQRIARRLMLPYFATSTVFRGCSEAFLVELGVFCQIECAPEGTLLVFAGEVATKLLLLCQGRLALKDAAGRLLSETSRRGELVGHVALLFDTKHAVSISTVKASRLVCLQRSDFLAVCELFPLERQILRQAVVAQLEGGGGERDADKSDDGASSRQKSRRSSGSSVASLTSATSVMQRVYGPDLQVARAKAQEERNQAKEDRICNFVGVAAEGDLERMDELLAGGEIGVDDADYDGRTALHLAVCSGNLSTVRWLLEKHAASLSVKDRFGHTPMDDAVREQRVQVARYLQERGARYQVDADVACLLCQAAFDADVDKLRLLLEVVGVDPNTSDYDRRTALHLAASQGHVAVVDLLISLRGINTSPRDRFGNTPLDDALRHRNHGARKALQQAGATRGDQQVGVVLCDLGSKNDWERLRDLAESGVAMSEGDYDSRTALHLAASEGGLQSATYLLNEARVDPNPLDRFLCTPLDDALRHSRKGVQSVLREHGGLSGSDPAMQERVERFKEWQERERAQKSKDKLDREMQSTEVHKLGERFRRFAGHATLEDDVHSFVAHAAAFRFLLLRLLRQSALSSAADEKETSEGGAKPDPECTKEAMERLLDQASVGMDASGAQLLATIEAELLPWTATLSPAEARLLRLYTPGLRRTLLRLRDQLHARGALRQAARRLLAEGGGAGRSAYQCPPLGLLLHRLSDAQMGAVCRARLDAVAMLWISAPPADDPAPQAPAPAAPARPPSASLALRLMQGADSASG